MKCSCLVISDTAQYATLHRRLGLLDPLLCSGSTVNVRPKHIIPPPAFDLRRRKPPPSLLRRFGRFGVRVRTRRTQVPQFIDAHPAGVLEQTVIVQSDGMRSMTII